MAYHPFVSEKRTINIVVIIKAPNLRLVQGVHSLPFSTFFVFCVASQNSRTGTR